MIINEQTRELDAPKAIRMLADFVMAEMMARLPNSGGFSSDAETERYNTLKAISDDCMTLEDAARLGLPVPKENAA